MWSTESFGSGFLGLATLLPLALVSALMPIRILVAARLSRPDRPLNASLAFLAGNWVWRVVLGGVVLSALDFDPELFARMASAVIGALLALVSIGLLVAAFQELWHPSSHETTVVDRWITRFDALDPIAIFFATITVSWWPGAQWLFVLTASAVIKISGIDAVAQWLVLGLFAALQLILVTASIVFTRLFPDRTDAVDRLERWLRRGVRSSATVKFAMGTALALLVLVRCS